MTFINNNFKLSNLLIIGILILSFSISFLLRSLPMFYGWELNEFDPFFNYRATEYIVENGIISYFQWHDDLSWYPNGRNVVSNSQVALHITTALTYSIFNFGQSLYDYSVLFPVIIGSSTSILIFFLVRTIGGTTTGLYASLIFSISLPILLRGLLGWLKSEPLGLFFGLLGLLLFLRGLDSSHKKSSISCLILSGIFTIAGLSAWGGNQFFIIVISFYIVFLPFVKTYSKTLYWKFPILIITLITFSFMFDRISSNFLTGFQGIPVIFSTIISLVVLYVIDKSSKNKIRNGIFTLAALSAIILLFLYVGLELEIISEPPFRYLNAINPFYSAKDALTDSVSEHGLVTIQQSFFFHGVIMIFSSLGLWKLLSHNGKFNRIKSEHIGLALIIGFIGIYLGSIFIRLEVFASISLTIFASIGLSFVLKSFSKNVVNKRKLKFSLTSLGVIILLIIPLLPITNFGFYDSLLMPPTILNGGTHFKTSMSDWNDALNWIKINTPKDSVIASWWDYGYWIQTKGERATLLDNSTLINSRIKTMAETFFSKPDIAWKKLTDSGADYILISISAQRFYIDANNGEPIYSLGGGGDESKKYWFARIANVPHEKYLYPDNISGKQEFWNNTLLGRLTPFENLGYVNVDTNQESREYIPGSIGVYSKNFKDFDNNMFELVYSSPSFDAKLGEPIIGVLIYKINNDIDG